MSSIDLESLLQPISEEAPAGEDLEYDPQFTEMERAAEGKPEQQMGDSVVEAQDPDWKSVRTTALDLLGRTRDFRVAVYLARGLLRTEGITGLNEGLSLIKGYLENFWETGHPLLDPDDANDPTIRVNALATLCDADTMVKGVREAPLVRSKALGIYSLRDHEVASGQVSPPADSDAEVPNLQAIDAAFLDSDLEELQATSDAVAASIDCVVGIENALTQIVGAAQSVDFSSLTKELKSQNTILLDQLARRGVGEGAEGEEGEGGAEPGQRITGEIKNREDVIRVLDKVCDYFNRYEPSSPVPLLLQRAKRLVSKDFMTIIADLAPSGLPEAEVFRGLDSDQV